jgi:hypothetical protein
MYAYAKVQALGIVAIGKVKSEESLCTKPDLWKGMYVVYATVLALGIIVIGNIIIGRKFMHQN